MQVAFNDNHLCCIKKRLQSKELMESVSINGEIQIALQKYVQLFYKFSDQKQVRDHFIYFNEDGDAEF